MEKFVVSRKLADGSEKYRKEALYKFIATGETGMY
jgi:hypothetical protein